MRTAFRLATLSMLAAGAMLAAGFSGRWQGTLTVEGNQMPGYLVLRQEGQQLTGTAGPDAQKQVKVTKSSVDGDRMMVEANPGASALRFELRLQDDKLTGDVLEDGKKIGTARFSRVDE